MFNIGSGELVLIAIVALLVLGPKRLPELARGLGKFLREFRRQTDEVRSVVEREFYKMDTEMDGQPPPVPQLAAPPEAVPATAPLSEEEDHKLLAAPDPEVSHHTDPTPASAEASAPVTTVPPAEPAPAAAIAPVTAAGAEPAPAAAIAPVTTGAEQPAAEVAPAVSPVEASPKKAV